MTDRYIVATDTPPHSQHTPARLYRLTGCMHRAELAGQGNLEQMQALANRLNNHQAGAADDRTT